MATRIRYSSGAFVYMPGKCSKKVRPGAWTSDWRAQLYSKGVIAIREDMSSTLN